MSDWDNWQPARPAAVIGSAAHRARAALSPASGGPPAGPARGGGWQQHPGTAAGGHADRGWGNKAAAGAPAVASTSQLPPINSRREDAATVAKRAADARMREKLQQEQSSSSDRTHRERERSRERYSASASSRRERYSASDRERQPERERERPRERDRDTRSDGKRRRSRSRSSRSPPRERERERDRHRRDRTDEGRDVRQRRDRSEERRSRGHSPRAKSPPRGPREEASRSRPKEQEKRVDVSLSPAPAVAAEEEDPEADEPFTDANYPTKELEEMPRIRIANIVAGTTILDMMSTFEDYGTILQCIRTQGGARSNALQTFEITYKRVEDAERACKTMNGVSADGAIIDVTLVTKKKKQPSPPLKEPTPEPQEMPGSEVPSVVEEAPVPIAQPVVQAAAPAVAVQAPSGAASLLSRISGPVPVSAKAVNGKKEARQKIKAPSSLEPFIDLLSRAGVKDIETLRKLVRKSTIPEYVEMLAKEYPDEELLKGLTGKWALRERLEDWLGVKEKSNFDWGSRLNGSSTS